MHPLPPILAKPPKTHNYVGPKKLFSKPTKRKTRKSQLKTRNNSVVWFGGQLIIRFRLPLKKILSRKIARHRRLLTMTLFWLWNKYLAVMLSELAIKITRNSEKGNPHTKKGLAFFIRQHQKHSFQNSPRISSRGPARAFDCNIKLSKQVNFLLMEVKTHFDHWRLKVRFHRIMKTEITKLRFKGRYLGHDYGRT